MVEDDQEKVSDPQPRANGDGTDQSSEATRGTWNRIQECLKRVTQRQRFGQGKTRLIPRYKVLWLVAVIGLEGILTLYWFDQHLLLFLALLLVTQLLFCVRHHSSPLDNEEPEPDPKASGTHEDAGQLKTWAIPLHDFRFHHEPYRRESRQANFIGRETLAAEFLALLNNSQNSSGSYLVTGYRGVGKTSLVKKVLHDYADGRHHLNLREKYDLFGPGLLRAWHGLQLVHGRIVLALHKYQSSRTRERREQHRSAPRFVFSWNWRNWSLFLWRVVHTLLWGAVVLIVLFWEPTPERKWMLLVLVFIIMAGVQFSKHGLDLLNPANWFRWLLRPVVITHIDLGHERLDPKKILFGLVHLLRAKYREPFGILSLATLIRWMLFLALTMVVSLSVYDLFRDPNEQLEGMFQSYLFLDDYAASEARLKNLHLPIPPKTTAADQNGTERSLSSDANEGQETYFRIRLIQTSPENKPGLEFEREFKLLITPIRTAESFAQPLRQNTTLYHLEQIAAIRKELGADMSRARLLCKATPSGSHTLSQAIYCGLDEWLVAAFCHDDPGTNKSSKTVCDPQKDNSKPRQLKPPEEWIHTVLADAIEGIYQLSNHFLHDPDEQERDALNGPRPYNIAFFVVVLLIIRGILGYWGRGRVIRMLDDAWERTTVTKKVRIKVGGRSIPLEVEQERQYSPLDVHQTETMFLDILEANNRIPRFLPRPDIVFVFDGLDKINPVEDETKNEIDTHRGHNLTEAVRRRKVEVEELLSNLKNLITIAPSQFIFIVGSEIKDANFPDQAASKRFYNSLFKKEICVPHLLDGISDGNDADIISMVEQYVCRHLLPGSIAYYLEHKSVEMCSSNTTNDRHVRHLDEGYRCWSLRVYAQYLKELAQGQDQEKEQQEQQELMLILQDLIYYLTYRSGGNPKKLALHFARFVTPISDKLLVSPLTHEPLVPLLPTTRFMLHIPLEEQHEIQLISQVFLLFYDDTSALIRKYGYRLAVATFSIVDHLFKFHSTGFSSRDLERITNLLDINRVPAVPQLINLLLERILAPCLSEVDNGIYEHRFLPQLLREVTYISQFSKQNLSTFNFILDNERDEAWTEYQNVLNSLEPTITDIEQPETKTETKKETVPSTFTNDSFSQLILYVNTLLKGGLICEQRRQFDHAATSYLQAMRMVDEILHRFPNVPLLWNNANQLYLLAQPAVSLAFLHAKRDIRPQNSFELLDFVEEQFVIASKKHFQDPGGWSKVGEDPLRLDFLHIRLWLRRAELLLFRSSFHEAALWFAAAARILVKQIDGLIPENQDFTLGDAEEKQLLPLRLLGDALSGLGDACAGMDLRQILCSQEKKTSDVTLLNDALEEASQALDLLGVHRWSEIKNKVINGVWTRVNDAPDFSSVERSEAGCEQYEAYLHTLRYRAVEIYARSAAVYRTGGRASSASLSLWKAAYLLAFGMTFSTRQLQPNLRYGFPEDLRLCIQKADETFFQPDIDRTLHERKQNPENPEDASPSRVEPSLIHEYATESFRWAYRTHRQRLKRIGVEDWRLLKWISPPLGQSMNVLEAFWKARVFGETSAIFDDVNIRYMGAFPVYPRILANYLKGRQYLASAFPKLPEIPGWLIEPSTGSEDPEAYKLAEAEADSKPTPLTKAILAFRCLVDAAEDGDAYEGDLDMLDPPLGFVYYHLWLTLKAIYRANNNNLSEKLEGLKLSDEFRGERLRFFETEFARTKAKILLREMLGRHGNDEGFFSYAAKHFYLSDSFSDPYVNGVWAVEYGLLPVASDMLKCLCCQSGTEAAGSD